MTHVLVLTWSVCFGSIVFICYIVSAGSSSQLVLILSLIFGWTLLKDVSLISFARKFCNLFLDQFGFEEWHSVLTWSACFGSIVFICYIVSAGSSSQLVLILSLIFGWTLSVKDVSLISFARKFCNLFLDQFGFWRLLLIHVLVLTWCVCFGSIVFICYIVSAGSSSQLVLILSLIFGWILSVKDVSLISFARKFCNLFLDQFGFEDFYFWHMF